MNTQNDLLLAKRAIAFAGVFVAGIITVLPVSAQTSKPSTSSPSSGSLTTPSETTTPSSDTPSDTTTPSETTSPTNPATPSTSMPNGMSMPQTPGTGGSMGGGMGGSMGKPDSGTGSELSPSEPTGGSSGGSTTPKVQPSHSSTTPATRSSAAPRSGVAASNSTIVQVAEASGQFKTLLAALKEANLTEELQGRGPFTIFAPTDEAFAALPQGTVAELLKPENREKLVKILTYHVVPGEVTSAQLASGNVQTVEGSPVQVMVNSGAVKVNDANVIQADIPASNGVIHAIDHVILPPNL